MASDALFPCVGRPFSERKGRWAGRGFRELQSRERFRVSGHTFRVPGGTLHVSGHTFREFGGACPRRNGTLQPRNGPCRATKRPWSPWQRRLPRRQRLRVCPEPHGGPGPEALAAEGEAVASPGAEPSSGGKAHSIVPIGGRWSTHRSTPRRQRHSPVGERCLPEREGLWRARYP